MYAGARLTWLVAGEGHLPYQQRILVPSLARLLQDSGLGSVLERGFHPLGLERVAASLDVPPQLAAIFLLIEIGSLWALLLAFRALAVRCGSSEATSRIATVLLAAILCLPQLLAPAERLWYPYDIPAVLVVVLGYLTLFTGRLWQFYAVFVIGCFNRETALFLLPILLLLPSSASGTKWPVLHTVMLAAVWGAVKTAIFLSFRGNHGYPLHPNLLLNIEILSAPGGLFAAAAVGAVCLLVTVSAFQKGVDVRLRAALKAALVFFGAIFLAGKVDELRVYAELAPLAVLMGLAALRPGTSKSIAPQ